MSINAAVRHNNGLILVPGYISNLYSISGMRMAQVSMIFHAVIIRCKCVSILSIPPVLVYVF